MAANKFWRFALKHAENLYDAFRLVLMARHVGKESTAPVLFKLKFEDKLLSVNLRKKTTDIDTFIEVFRDELYHLPEGFRPRTILDIGGNIGMASLYFSMEYPDALIHLFEPIPANISIAQTNILSNRLDKVFVHPFGLAGKDGQLSLTAASATEFWSYAAERTATSNTITVPIRDAAAVWDELGLSNVDLMKVDCEGAEVEVFRALGSRLLNVEILVGELHPCFTNSCEALHILSLTHFVDFEKRIDQQAFAFRASRHRWNSYSSTNAS